MHHEDVCAVFFRAANLLDILQAVSVTALLGLGITVTLAVGGFDLSVGSTAAMGVMASAYAQVVKVAFTSGWWPTGGGGAGSQICFAESIDGRSPFVRVGTCLASYLRPALKKFGSTYVLYAVNSSGQADVYTGTGLTNLTLGTSNVLSCGSNGVEQSGTLGHVEIWSTNNAGSAWNALYDCGTNSGAGFSLSYAIWKATASSFSGPWTKVSTTQKIGAGSPNQTTNAADVSGAFINVQSATALTAWAHTGPLGIVPTPYVYRYTSTDNGDTWAIDTNPMITARTRDEGVGSTVGQIANVALLDWGSLNETYLYYTGYVNGCGGILNDAIGWVSEPIPDAEMNADSGTV